MADNQHIDEGGVVEYAENEGVQDPEALAFEAKISTIKGGLYGALLGSAIGGLCNGMANPTEDNIFSALSLQGGGVLDLAQGQLSDEGELIILIAEGVKEIIENKQFDLSVIAKKVLIWKEDSTFKDTREFNEAFAKVSRSAEKAPLGYLLVEASQLLESSAFSSEPLVAIIPYSILIHLYPADIFPKLVLSFVSLFSHSQVSVDICLFFSLLVKYTIETLGNFQTAYEEAKNFFAESYPSESINSLLEIVESQDLKRIKQFPHGDIRLTFLLSLYTSLSNIDYMTALSVVLSEGSATSIYCTISGVVSGFKNQFESLPEAQIETIQTFNPEAEDIPRKRPNERKAFEIEIYLQSLINEFIINNVSDNIWESLQTWQASKEFLHLAEHEEEIIHEPTNVRIYETTDKVEEKKTDNVQIVLNKTHMNPNAKSNSTSQPANQSPAKKEEPRSNLLESILIQGAPLGAYANNNSKNNSNSKNTSDSSKSVLPFAAIILQLAPVNSNPKNLPPGVQIAPRVVKQLPLPVHHFETFKKIKSQFELETIGVRENQFTKEQIFEFSVKNLDDVMKFLARK